MAHIQLTAIPLGLRSLFDGWRARPPAAPRTGGDAYALAQMPSERLADMGLPARTEANRRHSGQAGPIPKAQLW